MHMTRLTALMIAVATLLAACSKPVSPAPIAQATPEPTPIPTPPPTPVAIVATPPPATPIPVPATPEPNYFAPEGIYFLVTKKSVETSDGITGLRPGTRVLKQEDGSYKTDDGVSVQAAPHEVTNDLRIAQQLVSNDAAASAALRQQAAQWHAAEQASIRPGPTPLPPGARVYSTTTIGADGRTTTTSTVTTAHTAPPRTAPHAPSAPTNKLERDAYGEKKVFKSDFDIRR